MLKQEGNIKMPLTGQASLSTGAEGKYGVKQIGWTRGFENSLALQLCHSTR